MHIVHINSHDQSGGASQVAQSLMQAQRMLGYQTSMATGYQTAESCCVKEIPNNLHRNLWARTWRQVADYGYKKCLPLIPRTARRLASWGEPGRMLRIQQGYEDFDYPGTAYIPQMFERKPDIFHAHNLHGNYFDLRQLPQLSQNTPFVLTLHDAWMLSGHCSHSFDCQRWKTGCGNCPDLTIYPAIKKDSTAENWQIKANIYQNSRLFITAPCQWLMDKIEASMLTKGMTAGKVIYNGVDLKNFHPADKELIRKQLDLPLNAAIVLFVSTAIKNSPFKDYQTMEAAIRIVAQNTAEKEVVFVCLGENAEDQKIGNLSIRFMGRFSEPEMIAKYYQAADIYLHAARIETFPMATLEAAACGLPVIASAVGGIPEQIADGQTGFLTHPGNSEVMAQRILTLLDNPDLCQQMGQNAAKLVQESFSKERMAQNYLDWYLEVLEHTSKNIQKETAQ